MSMRSLIAVGTTLALTALIAGCGNPAASRLRQSPMLRPGGAAPLPNHNAGKLVLRLSPLMAGYAIQATREDVAALEIRLTGPSLSAPIVRLVTAAELDEEHSVEFEGVPVGQLDVSVTAIDQAQRPIGTKSTQITVLPQAETDVKLKLKLDPTVVTGGEGQIRFDFDIEDGDVVFATPEASPSATPTPDASATPIPSPTPDTVGGLAAEVVETKPVGTLFKRLAVTVKVTNANTTTALDGRVRVEFLKKVGLFNRQIQVVETQHKDIEGLAPGAGAELSFTSTKVAIDDMRVTVEKD